MAKATRIQETVTKREKVNRIQLTLTEGEADFLQAVLASIGGDPALSPRKYQERISKALREATGQSFMATDANKLKRGFMSFDNYPGTRETEDIFAPPSYRKIGSGIIGEIREYQKTAANRLW